LREGLNLLPLEYIYARKDTKGGAVVVSEFSTCSSLLNGSLKVNPFAIVNVSDTLEKALSLTQKDCEYRKARDLPFITSHPASLWTRKILNELEQFQSKSGKGRTRALKLPDPLSVKALEAAYRAATQGAELVRRASKVFIFEYGGVLLHKEKFDIYIKQTLSAISGRRPTERMMDTLKRLSEEEGNVVVVMTGLTQMKLGDIFKDLPNVVLGTSNGLVYSWGRAFNKTNAPLPSSSPPSPSRTHSSRMSPVLSLSPSPPPMSPTSPTLPSSTFERTWGCLDCNVNWTAVQAIASPIISRYTFRTNGTCQSPRFPGIAWSYFGADPEWGLKQAAQLVLELEAALIQHDVTVTSLIPGSIEVIPRTLDKGALVRKVLQRALEQRAGKLPGLIAVVGGDDPDEAMTQAVLDEVAVAPVSAGL
ncbi:MAG: hypothetical protein EOO70_08030, partial [Myxococcaceae bacterium]